mmetsp:Transcript_37650/g.79992  ORF Transcript_37650/g.79992 Transcript_37650/m.79992 type:complete len:332 (+) Transcript_37650:51-1046(+)
MMAEVDDLLIPDLKGDQHAHIESRAGTSIPQPCRWHGDLEDTLDMHGASEELMVALAAREAKALMTSLPYSKQSLPLPQRVRMEALQVLERIVVVTELPPTSWFVAATLLDTYCLRAPVEHSLWEVALHGIVALRIIDKRNEATAWRTRGSLLNTSSIMGMLRRYTSASDFSPPPEYTDEHLKELEAKFLAVLEWQGSTPSLADWIMVFSTRFNVYTCGAYLPWITWVREQCLLHAKALVLWGAVDTELPPRCVAAGLLGLNLVRGKLLSLEALKATEAAPHDRVLEVLEASVMWPREELGEICRRVGLVQMKHVEQMHAKFKLEFGQVSC